MSTSKDSNYRYERKFLITDSTYSEVIVLIKNHPKIFREIFSKRLVNNIYLDTWDRKSYHENDSGISERIKYRIRWYGNIFHNCNDKKNWSRVVRHGQSAHNFFEKKTYLAPRTGHQKATLAYPSGSKFNTSYKGKIQLRKKKYRNTKYNGARKKNYGVWLRKFEKEQFCNNYWKPKR